MSNKKEFALSASRISDYNTCSLIYYFKNVLFFDDGGNCGATRGSICHDIFEVLIKEKYKERVEKIIQYGSIECDEGLLRLVRAKIHQYKLSVLDEKGNDNLQLIKDMIYVGLNTDFYCDGWDIDYDNLEKKFTLKNENPKYVLRGLIDKPAKKDGKYWISDYKSSSKPHSNEKLEFEIQALSYILFAKKELLMSAFVDFIFLRFPKNPIRSVKDITSAQLAGFEEYLADLYAYLKDFNEQKALSNLAYDQGFKSGFAGRIVCGNGLSKGELKNDGSKKWCCFLKFPFTYYSLRDKDGDIKKSAEDKNSLDLEEKGDFITEEYWEGCPRWN